MREKRAVFAVFVFLLYGQASEVANLYGYCQNNAGGGSMHYSERAAQRKWERSLVLVLKLAHPDSLQEAVHSDRKRS